MNTPIIAIYRLPSAVLFICRNEYGKVSLLNFEVIYFRPSRFEDISLIVAAGVDSQNPNTLFIVSSKHVVYSVDLYKNTVIA